MEWRYRGIITRVEPGLMIFRAPSDVETMRAKLALIADIEDWIKNWDREFAHFDNHCLRVARDLRAPYTTAAPRPRTLRMRLD